MLINILNNKMIESNLITELLKKAAKIALNKFRNVTPSFKDNNTYVTEADYEVQSYLKEELDIRYPDYGIIAEENNLRKEPSSGNRFWVIDPIDGTAAFVSGLPVWGIAVGLMENNRAIAGFFIMPATGDLFYSISNDKVYRNGHLVKMKAPENFHKESLLLTTSGFHRKYKISEDFPGKTRCLGSTVAHLCYLATGSADAVFISKASIWDIVAGLAMIANNGGVLKYMDGSDLLLSDFFLTDQSSIPILAGHESTVKKISKIILS